MAWCYAAPLPPLPPQPPVVVLPGNRMAFGVVDAASAHMNTAVARVGYDNDGFMSTRNDGGTWGPQYTGAWGRADRAPLPAMGEQPATSSLATPMYPASHGPYPDPDFGYIQRESPWVPMDGEMFWNAGAHVYDPAYPMVIDAESAAWRLRDLHYTTLSMVHGYSPLDAGAKAPTGNETIDHWMITPLNTSRILRDRLPISPTYLAAPGHTGYVWMSTSLPPPPSTHIHTLAHMGTRTRAHTRSHPHPHPQILAHTCTRCYAPH